MLDEILLDDLGFHLAQATALLRNITEQACSKRAEDALHLTNREKEIFSLIKKGLKSADIAKKLELSTRTIEVYRQHIREKLGLKGTRRRMI